MTDSTRELDEILAKVSGESFDAAINNPDDYMLVLNAIEVRAKQAITSLIKELVEEAKPAEKDQQAQSTLDDESRCRYYRYGGYNFAIYQFEQNLLKALEEV